MRFQLNIEVDESQTKRNSRDLIEAAMFAVQREYNNLGVHYDIGYSPESLVLGNIS